MGLRVVVFILFFVTIKFFIFELLYWFNNLNLRLLDYPNNLNVRLFDYL